MGVVGNGFSSSISSSKQIAYGENINETWGFITWNGKITDVYCEEYRNGSYYTTHTLISNSECVDSRAEWGMYQSIYSFNYGQAYQTTKLVMYITTTLGNAVLTEEYIVLSACKPPTAPTLTATVSRDAVELSWGAGSAGTGNNVTGYDVQYRESSDGSSWGSWTTDSGSPVTGTKLSVSPSGTVGNYRQYRVRTRGSAGESYYSGWVTSTNTLRRKWNAFGAWTDATLTAGVSGIRAVHMTQLQERVAVIRAFYGMAAYSFTAVTARKTKIAKWAALIGEIRTAIDQITTGHEAWNTLEAGKPRIAHITQLRRIIDNL